MYKLGAPLPAMPVFSSIRLSHTFFQPSLLSSIKIQHKISTDSSSAAVIFAARSQLTILLAVQGLKQKPACCPLIAFPLQDWQVYQQYPLILGRKLRKNDLECMQGTCQVIEKVHSDAPFSRQHLRPIQLPQFSTYSLEKTNITVKI